MSDATFSIPCLRTPRLFVREYRTSDFAAFAKHMADPDATKYMGGPFDRRTAWRLFLTNGGAWAICGAGWWTVEVIASGEVVGSVGAFFREGDIDAGREANLEFGWMIYRPYENRGYAKEAAAKMAPFMLARTNPKRAIAYIDRANVSSVAVSRSIGMRFVEATHFYGTPSDLYAISRSEFPGAPGNVAKLDD